MTIGLVAGLGASVYLVVWSAMGNWAIGATPMWFLWLAVAVLLVAGLILAGLGRITRFFPRVWANFASVAGIGCLVSAVVCFANGQGRYGVPLLVWMVVLAITFYLATLADREV